MSAPRELAVDGASVVQALDLAADGDTLLVGHDTLADGAPPLSLYSLARREKTKDFPVGGDATRPHVMAARFSPDGTSIAYTDTRLTPRLLDIVSGADGAIEVDEEQVRWLAFARDAPLLVIAGERTQVWSLEDRATVWTLPSKTTTAPALAVLSADGRRVAVSGAAGTAVVVLDVKSGKLIQRLEDGPEESRWLDFDADGGRLVAVEAYSEGVFLWDLDSGERALADDLNEDAIAYTCAAFRPGAPQLALGMRTGIVRVIDLRDGSSVLEERAHRDRVWDLVFARDGRTLVTGGADGRALLWALD